MDAPRSPIGGYPMRLRMVVPTDWRRPGSQESFDLYWSDEEEYGMVYPRPTDTASYYDIEDYYTHQSDIAKDGKNRSWLTRLIVRVSWLLDKTIYIDSDWYTAHFGPESQRILDIGCGSGRILSELKAIGHTVVGLEPDPAARDVAQAQGLTVYPGMAEAVPEELVGSQFDTIFMTHVLEHSVDPLKSLRSVVDLLADGGKLIVEVPNNAAVGFQRSGLTWRWLDVPRHLNFFTPHSLRKMCKTVGLEHDRTEFRGYTRQFHAEWIANEQEIWDRYEASLNGQSHILPKRSTTWQSLKLLSQTIVASDEKRYDSVRVIAYKR
ncbi:MAG: class I SAM-dependent methyltransferase [Candidatus Promineifilaceae bacterium]